MVIVPFLSAVSGASAYIHLKSFLSNSRISYKKVTAITFLTTALILGLMAPFFFEFSISKLSFQVLFSFGLIVVLGTIYNVLFYHGFKDEDLSESENLIIFYPLFLVLLSFLFYPDERKPLILIPTLIATVALVISHMKRHHFSLHKANKLVLAAVFLNAVETLFVKSLLEVFNPFTLYFLRCLFIALLLNIFIKPKISLIFHKHWKELFTTQGLMTVHILLLYWSIKLHGIVLTSLILNITPILAYLYAIYYMHEQIAVKKTVAMSVILFCVIFVQVLPWF